MFKRFLSLGHCHYRRIIYGFITFIIAISISLSNIQPSHALSWLELMIRGIQVVQLSNISNSQELELGKGINQEIISSGKAKILNNSSINSYINQIGQKLARNSDRSESALHFSSS